eukprot:jgi/Mesen1/2898/ME000175S02044
MSRQYAVIDPTKGGKRSALVLAMAMIGSVAILVASVFLGIKLASEAGEDDPAPPPPPPPPQIRANITSTLEMSLLFLQAQKSGKLPEGFPISWRNDSGLTDGLDQNKDLSGGLYSGGGNIKNTYPLAFSTTMLAWGVLEYQAAFAADNSLQMTIDLLNWNCEYLLKAFYQSLVFAQIGDPLVDDGCFMRPEDQKAAQRPTALPCDVTHPCSDLAAEMAAALAASSLVFRLSSKEWANTLLVAAEQLWTFADTYRGVYSQWVDVARTEWNSTGYEDELMWGASWLYFASSDDAYLEYLTGANMNAWSTNQFTPETALFDFNNKAPGVQVLMSRLLLLGYGKGSTLKTAQELQGYLNSAKLYVCNYLPANAVANFTSIGRENGLVWAGTEDHPIEYAVNVAFLALVFSDYLSATTPRSTPVSSWYLDCAATFLDVATFAQSQANYIMGANPMGMSYMIGYGPRYPLRPYHMASAIPAEQYDTTQYTCTTGRQWLDTSDPNPNLLVGAVVGGPNMNDTYFDVRGLRNQSEPKIQINAVFAGLLAGLRNGVRPGNSLTRMWIVLPAFYKFAAKVAAKLPPPAPNPPGPAGVPPPWTPPPPPPPGVPLPPYTTPPPPSPPFKAPNPPPPNPPPDFPFG